MSYIGIDPNININRFKEIKPIQSYPDKVLKAIKLLSFSKNKLATPFGSYIYRIQKFPGDIDLLEEYTECCDENDVINKFSKSLKRIVKNIKYKRLHYFSEVKAGIDYRYNINIGNMNEGIYHINKYLNDVSDNLFYRNLLSLKENEIIQYIYNLSKNKILGSDEYDTINYIFRERRILRWSIDEILLGKKILPGNEEKKLNEALRDESPIKIDLLTIINGKFTEITNFLQLAYEENGLLHTININLKEKHFIPIELPKEIEKLYFSNMYYSPFKMVKRMYSLGRHNNDNQLLYKIIPFISSNTSLLYQIKSEIDTIILILEKSKSYPYKSIIDSLNDNKIRISTVLELSKDELMYIDNLINEINDTDNRYNKINKLKYLKKILNHYINMETINYLNKVGMNPPNYKYLPPYHTYNYNMVRGIHDDPKNPYYEYNKIIEKNKTGYGGYNVYYPTESHHFPNFFEDPNSSSILSHNIISNPGLNEIPNEDIIRRQLIDDHLKELQMNRISQKLSGGAEKIINAWWSAFSRRYRNNNNNNPPIDFYTFTEIVQNEKKYDYKKFLNKIQQQNIKIYENPLEKILNKCEDRTDKLIDFIINKPQQVREIMRETQKPMIVPEHPIIPKGPPLPPSPPKMEEILQKKDIPSPAFIVSANQLQQQLKSLKKIQQPTIEQSANIAEGNLGGYAYSHRFTIPLYVNENLKLPPFLENEMRFHPQTASSTASDYYSRGYGPSLKGVNILNAPLVVNGQIMSYHQAGCEYC